MTLDPVRPDVPASLALLRWQIGRSGAQERRVRRYADGSSTGAVELLRRLEGGARASKKRTFAVSFRCGFCSLLVGAALDGRWPDFSLLKWFVFVGGLALISLAVIRPRLSTAPSAAPAHRRSSRLGDVEPARLLRTATVLSVSTCPAAPGRRSR